MTRRARRDAVRFLVGQGLSERRACQMLAVARSTVQYQARPDHNVALRTRLAELAERHPRYGYRRVWALLRREGWAVNLKRVRRLWRQAQFQVRKATRRRRSRKVRTPDQTPTQATHPGHVWTYDFVQDRCLNGTVLKLLTVLDEFTRECLVIQVATTLPAMRVLAVLDRLFGRHGAPQFLRSDNGPEFIALAIQFWLARHQTATLYIDPGCPWQNGYIESFNGTLREECLNMQAFASVAEAQIQAERFRRHYNDPRPQSRLAYRTPTEFKADWLASQSAPTRH